MIGQVIDCSGGATGRARGSLRRTRAGPGATVPRAASCHSGTSRLSSRKLSCHILSSSASDAHASCRSAPAAARRRVRGSERERSAATRGTLRPRRVRTGRGVGDGDPSLETVHKFAPRRGHVSARWRLPERYTGLALYYYHRHHHLLLPSTRTGPRRHHNSWRFHPASFGTVEKMAAVKMTNSWRLRL